MSTTPPLPIQTADKQECMVPEPAPGHAPALRRWALCGSVCVVSHVPQADVPETMGVVMWVPCPWEPAGAAIRVSGGVRAESIGTPGHGTTSGKPLSCSRLVACLQDEDVQEAQTSGTQWGGARMVRSVVAGPAPPAWGRPGEALSGGEKEDEDGRLYLCDRDGGTRQVKIGLTRETVEERLRALQAEYPAPLALRGSVRVRKHLDRVKKHVHGFLAAQRLQGEWFAVDIDATQLADLVTRAQQVLTANASLEERIRVVRVSRP